MKTMAILMLMAALACGCDKSKNLTGTWTISRPDASLILTLTEDANGALSGSLSNVVTRDGHNYPIAGHRDGDALSFLVTTNFEKEPVEGHFLVEYKGQYLDGKITGSRESAFIPADDTATTNPKNIEPWTAVRGVHPPSIESRLIFLECQITNLQAENDNLREGMSLQIEVDKAAVLAISNAMDESKQEMTNLLMLALSDHHKDDGDISDTATNAPRRPVQMLRLGDGSTIPAPIYNQIRRDATDEFPNDYSEQVYIIKQQVKAWQQLHPQ